MSSHVVTYVSGLYMGEGLGRGLDKLRSDKTQALSRSAACHEPRNQKTALTSPSPRVRGVGERVRQTAQQQNPGFIPFGGLPRAQHLSRLAACYEPRNQKAAPTSPSPRGRGVGERVKQTAQRQNPSFIPLGGLPRAQKPESCTSKPLALWERVRQTAQRQNPGFIPLGGLPRAQKPESCTNKLLVPWERGV
ncbi:Uncharacterised protein [Cardiobacterium valvarum]|uniref:Uncharacterized protein n=1 Tax=Cardiobacterium valvarum TaxID=194702 RepID=A0A381E6V9_9GAMM|nr:Uncharacterised protein [Cardiobacterium valvarum]